MTRVRISSSLAIFFLILLSAGTARAIPAFVRKYNVGCDTCHVAFPLLNATGRRFREAGYRLVGKDGKVDPSIQNNKDISSGLTLGSNFPLAAMAKGWFFESTPQRHAQNRPVSSASILVAGNWASQGSNFAEVGADDEGGWTPDVSLLVGYHPSRYVNVLAGIREPFAPDPYNTFRDPISFSPRSSVDRIADDDVGRPTLEAYGRVRSRSPQTTRWGCRHGLGLAG